jgi:hypothetical protein
LPPRATGLRLASRLEQSSPFEPADETADGDRYNHLSVYVTGRSAAS